MKGPKKAVPDLVFQGFIKDEGNLDQGLAQKLAEYILNLYSQKQRNPDQAMKPKGEA